VPLLVNWPGETKAGAVCESQVSSIDLLPTIAEICKAPAPATLDGVSVTSLLRQTGELATRPLFWHYPHYSNQGGRPGGAVRLGNDKLIEFYDTGRRELFDLKADPGESTNLSDKFPDKVEKLAALLGDWRGSVAAQGMSLNPDYAPNPQSKDGSVTLAAKSADVHGVMLRFEPLPHKNTLGYWVRADDWASWEFDLTRPGKFRVEILQGCGTGSGGSEVEFAVGDQKLAVTVEETGGFQKFVRREIGTIDLARAGRQTLTVRPLKKPGAAVMDLRELKLVALADEKGN
jgi:hypothetical protein